MQPDAPHPAGELAEPAADLDAVAVEQAWRRASASSTPSGTHTVVSSGSRWPSAANSSKPRSSRPVLQQPAALGVAGHGRVEALVEQRAEAGVEAT